MFLDKVYITAFTSLSYHVGSLHIFQLDQSLIVPHRMYCEPNIPVSPKILKTNHYIADYE